MASSQQAGSIIFGGFFVGLWLFLCLFRTDLTRDVDVGAWTFFGVIGLALAGGMYGTRVASPGLRTALYVVLGIAIAFLTAAFVLQQLAEGVAALITFVGAALVVTALPAPERDGAPAAQP
jgi:small-conductance mechanosensitive channel